MFHFGKMTPKKFARLILKQVRSMVPDAEFHEEDFSIRKADGEATFLGNFFDEYLRADNDDERAEILAAVVTLVVEEPPDAPETFEEARELILPRLQERVFTEFNELRARMAGEEPARIDMLPVGTSFGLCLILDYPKHIAYFPSQDLAEWGRSFDEAMEVAVANLREATVGGLEELESGLYLAPWEDTHNATRICLPELFEGLNVVGDIVVAIPNRDSLLVTGSDDIEGLKRIHELVVDAREHPRFMRATLLRRRGRQWVDYLPDRQHELYEDFYRLKLESLLRDYGEQGELLEAVLEQEGRDVYVADYSVMENEDGRYANYCVWSQGVESWLPQAEMVALVADGTDDPIFCPWGIVLGIVGDLLRPLGMIPERYEVSEFPSAEQLRLLSEHAGEP